MSREAFQYALVQVVPRLDRGELVNVGVIVFARTLGYLAARIELDEARLAALAPDLEPSELRPHLETLVRVAAGDPEAGADRRDAALRALSLAHGSVEHRHPDLAGSHGSVRRPGADA